MPPFQSFAAVRARGLRASTPKTPEPRAEADNELPSPPRQRFRLKRRNAPQLSAPTQQFLASVAAADIPIPSIEEPCVVDEDMIDIQRLHTSEDTHFQDHLAPERLFSPPKTPAPTDLPLLSGRRFPDWSMGSTASSPESSPDSSRPSTSRSTHTSASFFSQLSFTSEDLNVGEDSYVEHPAACTEQATIEDGSQPPLANPSRRRRMLWTKPMSQHLWSTYMLYLQDPTVTPVRIGKSGVPPDGACSRIAREAKRSWKGSKTRQESGTDRATTSTSQDSAAFIAWPHTRAATMAHLREMCKANAATTPRSHQFMARSPTPLTRMGARLRNRRATPLHTTGAFSSSDMAMSLAVSTSTTMQPQGPLAQLALSQQPLQPDPFLSVPAKVNESVTEPEGSRARLGSPFAANSYGPSSSKSLAESLGMSVQEQRQTHTVGPWRNLGSPAKFTRSQSSIQKRRSRQTLLEARRSKRPSLAPDFWVEPAADDQRSPPVPQLAEFSSTSSSCRDQLFVPRTNIQELFETTQPPKPEPAAADPTVAPTDDALASSRARLGSPFSATSSSWSFPQRLSSAAGNGFGAIRRPFATVQQPADGSQPTPKTSLASRLAYIDERLRDLRRSHSRRRSQSPS